MTAWVDSLPLWGQIGFGLAVSAAAGTVGSVLGWWLSRRTNRLREQRMTGMSRQ